MKIKYKKIIIKQIISILYLILVASSLYAAEAPNLNREISIIAREQPIESFLKELFSQLDLPLVVDESVEGLVNGSFDKISASKVLSDVARSFGLVMYYDGAVVYVYSSNNITRRILPASNRISKRIVRAAYDLNLVDNKNSISRAVDGGLVVTGTRRFIEQIDELLYAAKHNEKDYDPPVGFKVFYLRYAWAQDVTLTFAGKRMVIPGVATILRELVEDNSRGYTVNRALEKLVSPSLQGLRGNGLNSIGKDERIGLPDNQNIYSAGMNKTQIAEPIAYNNNVSANRKSIVRIQADPRLNAIIVRDSPDRMSRYQYLIDALDIEPQMVEIEATIIDINTEKLKNLGINWRWQNNDDEVLFGSGGDSDLRLNPVGSITPTGRGGYISFVLGDNAKFIGRINALEEEGAAKIVSRPNVLTLSNVEAIFDTSSTFFVRVEGQEEVDLYNVSVGTSLRVTPHVFKDNGESRIKLLVTIEDGQQTTQEVDGIPVIEESAINTQALINADESVLIGGLVREVSQDNEEKVPLLGDLPIMGHLFKNNSKQSMRIERLFLISPRLSIRRVHKNDKLSDIKNDRIEETMKDIKSHNTNNDKKKIDTKNTKQKKNWEILLNM